VKGEALKRGVEQGAGMTKDEWRNPKEIRNQKMGHWNSKRRNMRTMRKGNGGLTAEGTAEYAEWGILQKVTKGTKSWANVPIEQGVKTLNR